MVFAYNPAGRIRAKGATLATATAYAYTDPSKPDHAPSAVTTAGVTTTFTYDANGNMLTGLGGKIMTYDAENRPLSVTHLGKRTCYVYGVDGKRLKKVEGLPPTQDCTALPATAATTVYFGAVEVRNWLVAGAEQVLTYPHPAVKLLNGTTPTAATYLHRDGLSSVRAITNAAGVKIESALYKPFGEQSEWVLPGNAAPETKGWIGERYDADAGLQYLNARYYDPELSLFLQPDWFEVTKAGVGTNRFSYSFNDPVNRADPNGNEATKDKAGTLKDWLKDLFGSPSKMGDTKGNEASKKLISESATNVFGQPKSGYFTGTAKTRYVYTAKKGWIDMGHFVFWAGYAHNHKQSAPPRMSDEAAAKAAVAAVKSASYQQEGVGSLLGTRSGYSYEDLPSNLLGAIFGAEVFDPKSSMSLGDQISKYMEQFDPRDPSESPNWKDVPSTEQVAEERYRQADVDPVPRNYTFDPMFILE